MKIRDMSSVQLEEAAAAIDLFLTKMADQDLEGWHFVAAVRIRKDSICREIDRRARRNSENTPGGAPRAGRAGATPITGPRAARTS